VQPDILAVLAHRHAILTHENIQGAPDLVVEILSTSSRRIDLGKKHELYELWRVPEYWVVDGEAGEVQQLPLCEGRYAAPRICSDEIVFRGCNAVRIDLRRVWS
jgi:Uma2 family endonuclease